MPRKLVISFLKLFLKFICHCIPEETERVDFLSGTGCFIVFQLRDVEISIPIYGT